MGISWDNMKYFFYNQLDTLFVGSDACIVPCQGSTMGTQKCAFGTSPSGISWNFITYLDLRKGTNNCPFARFVPLRRISCDRTGHGHCFTTVVNFEFGTFWADLTLVHKIVSIFLGGNYGKRIEMPGQTQHG